MTTYSTAVVIAPDAFQHVANALVWDNFLGSELMDTIFVEPETFERCWIDERSMPASLLEAVDGDWRIRGYRLHCATVFVLTGTGVLDEVYIGPPGMSLGQYIDLR